MTAQPLAEPGEGRRDAFRAAARNAGLDPDDKWAGGYVDYEWEHLRPVLKVYGIDPEGRTALEFGCNVGASGVVLAKLGADVTGVDVDPAFVEVSRANIALHGVNERACAIHVPDTRDMPFEAETFDFAVANSVLEYVPPEMLVEVMVEIHRVMKPGAKLLVLGTASRIAPREVHSHRWLVNYLPRAFDALAGRELQRGLSPLLLRKAIAGKFSVEAEDSWLTAREQVHGTAKPSVRLVARFARMLGLAPGWLSPNIELLLRRT